MNKFSKILTCAATAAALTVTAAAPAEAQYRYRDRDRDGISTGDILTGVAIVGGIAAAAGAISSATRNSYDYGRYGYGYGNSGYGYGNSGYGYGNTYGYSNYRYGGEQAAVSACGYQAQRYGRGQVSITDVDRKGSRSFRVHGIINGNNYGGYYNRGYGYDRYNDGVRFSCTARYDGRVTDFDTRRL